MLKSLAVVALASEILVAPIAELPPYAVYDRQSTLSSDIFAPYYSVAEYWKVTFSTHEDGLGLWYIDSSYVYDSVSDLPSSIPEGFTAFIRSGDINAPSIEDARFADDPPILYYLPNSKQGYQRAPVSVSSSGSHLFALRCVYYSGEAVSSSLSPLFVQNDVFNPQYYNIAWYKMSGVEYPTFSSSIGWLTGDYFSNYLIPCLTSAGEFVPVSPSIEGDDALTLTYNLGHWLSDTADSLSAFFNFTVFGYPLYQLTFGVGFMLVVGWIILRFVIP